MAGAALGFVCIILVIGIPIGLMIGAALLMGAIALANKCLPQPHSRYDDYEDAWDDYEGAGDNEPPSRSRKRNTKTAIPPPSLGHAVMIVFVNGIIGFVVNKVFEIAMQGVGANDLPTLLVILAFNLTITFLISAGVLTQMLPTTFPRACLVVLFEYLIALAIVLIFVVPIALNAGIGMAGMR
ncbi:unnamed protein product [Gemmata massiliana]|uniref:Uncharacterized protein n=1 Tax=Gemmata massiliana TaxID=1210884 RepID=A0A6P2CTP3_9BACT|nr:hypothetical protein [Gemmata massiliana]VTR92273.1 unnamed protein product [Gemmata massiliana]